MKLECYEPRYLHINPQAAGYATTQVEALYRTIEDRFHSLPGVGSRWGWPPTRPWKRNNWGTGVKIQGEPDPEKGASWVKGTAILRFGGNTRRNGPGIFYAGHAKGASRRGGESGVRQAVLRRTQPHRPPLRPFPIPAKMVPMRIVGVVEDTTYTSVYWKKPRHVLRAADAAASELRQPSRKKTFPCMPAQS